MIVETNGKKIAFGLEWKLLIKGGAPATLATKQALEEKARLMWHDGQKLYTGLVLPTSKISTTSGTLYAAAEAFLRLPGLPTDALLVLRTPDQNIALIGIKDGRPRRGFDQDGLSEETARDLLQQFGTMCGERGFSLVGDTTLPFMASAEPFSLEELSELADAKCVLKPPSRAATYRRMGYVAVAACAGIFFGPALYTKYVSPPTPEEQKTPTELYQEYVAAHLGDPLVRAVDYTYWYAWARSLAPSYGGWSLTKVDCTFRNRRSQPGSYQPWNGVTLCTLGYERSVRAIATNETFVRAAPKEYVDGKNYDPATDTMTVALQPTVIRPTPIRTLLQSAVPAAERDVHFVSVLQRAANLAKSTAMSPAMPFLMPPGTARANVQAMVYMTAGWKLDGQFKYAEFLSKFPANATLSQATLTIDRNAAADSSPYKVALAGEVITNN